ncbi:uncharacterized protein MJAP1_003763 [Malassezia japonica]|uniref:Uncharacterized protein n=1 Tax=Malassezia japonica TaxID=223818 RepID=A0AAF0F6E7_9BASI|nr:uncharacterized protein MJAP1_003763 [Malassezia japonica]WFD40774.1 hypothetical protein MJAP1_003763 [Malassezia japonica]
MDQQAFRNLVSAPRADGARSGQGYDRNFGQRRSYHPSERRRSAKNEEEPDEFKPRQVASTEFRGSHSKHAYVDRAEMRRRGIDVPLEFRPMPIEEPEAGADEDNDRAHVSDADLDAALEAGRTVQEPANDAPAFRPITQAAQQAPAPKEEAPEFIYVNGKRMRKKKKKAPETSAPAPESHAASTPGDAADRALTDPAALRPRAAKSQVHVRPAVNEKGSAPEPTVSEHAQSQAVSPSTSGPAPPPPSHDAEPTHDPSTTPAPPSSSTFQTHDPTPPTHASTSRPAAPPSFVPQVEDEDDIFAEAGEWAGLSDEEAPEPSAAPSGSQRDWFATKTQDEPAPPSEPEDEEREDSPPARLEGLSTSALPSDVSRWLLEREDKPRHTDRDPAPRKRKRSKKGRGEIDSP